MYSYYRNASYTFYTTFSDKSIRSKVFIAAYFRAVKTTVALGYTTVMIFLSCSQGKGEWEKKELLHHHESISEENILKRNKNILK